MPRPIGRPGEIGARKSMLDVNSGLPYGQLLHLVAGAGALALLGLILWEVFETIVLPQRVSRRLRLTRIYFRLMGRAWMGFGGRIRDYQRRENVLGVFGPLSLLLLLALWAALLIVGFAGLQWALGSALTDPY